MPASRLRLPLLVAALLLVASGARPPAERAEFRVVAHGGSPVHEMRRRDVSGLFLKQATSWPDGESVMPVDQPERSPVRAAFTHAVHRRTLAAVRAYWQQQVFTGSRTPPPTRATDAEVLEWVRKTPGAVGYVSSAAAPGPGVHVIELRD